MSKSARRHVRQAVKLATELGNVYSVELQGVVWTLRHPERQQEPKSKSAETDEGCVAITRRAEKSAARLKEFQTALRFRIGILFKRWSQSTQLRSLPQALPPPPIPPLPQPSPKPTTKVLQQPPTQQPPSEQMDDERAPKRAPSTPLAADSPATPRAKRTLLLPPGLPPPSIPPSPPSSASTPSPAMTRDAAVAASSSKPAAETRGELVAPTSSGIEAPSATRYTQQFDPFWGECEMCSRRRADVSLYSELSCSHLHRLCEACARSGRDVIYTR